MEQDRIKHTIWGQSIQAQLFTGTPIKLMKNSTLNEKLNINPTSRLESGDRPAARWYCIGYGGHRIITASDRPDIPDVIDHDPTDSAPYDIMPFVLRRTNADLTETQRANYRLRRKETIGGTEYYAYYLKKIEIDEEVHILQESTVDGVKTDLPYTATENNLSPQKPALTPRRVTTTSNVKMRVSIGAQIVFTEFDVQEILEVAKIKFGDTRYAVISEIGIVTGVDGITRGDGVARLNEIKGATIVSFLSTYHAMVFSNDGFIERLELGEKTPLMTNSPLITTVGTGPGQPKT